MSPREDEFYVGYFDKAPAGIARLLRPVVVALLLTAAAVAVTLAATQSPFAVAFFDFGAPRTFEGTVRMEPHPMLLVDRPGAGPGAAPSSYLLVGFGKAGAEADVASFAGQRVRLEATPIYRDDQTMLEIVPGSVNATEGGSGTAHTSAERSLGAVTLEGEIVDSKCHLGVMKPGSKKAHRACATLCIRGGIPPMLVLRKDDLPVRHLLLVGPRGEAVNDQVLDFVAEPVRISGELVQRDDLYILKADPSTIARL